MALFPAVPGLFTPGAATPGDPGGVGVVTVVNQWAATFAQPAAFGTTPPALQSVVLPLTAGTSVGGGSGASTAGNWLFCLVGMNEQSATAGFTVGDADDIHSYWRPAQVSTATALTRASCWYTPNIARVVNDVYVAPNGAFDALSVLVVEVSGLGAWDVVTGAYSNYAAAATSLNLALAAPSASSFMLAAVAGDNDSVSQAFAPGGWTTLHTVTATNGANHVNDSVLTSAYLASNSSSVSVNGTASSAEDLSGVIIGVQVNAPSPVPGGSNPAWPYIILEAGFGSGFETPQDSINWTTVTKRFWSFNDASGIPYALGQLQSSSGAYQLDNWDGSLSPSNPGGLFYSNALNENMSFNMVYPLAGITPWTGVNGATVQQSMSQAFASAPGATATYSLEVMPNGSTATPGAASEQVAGITAGSVYSASAWFYYVGAWATGAQVAISWYNSSHTLISTSTVTATAIPASTWTQVTNLNVTAPALTAYAVITSQFAGTPPAVTPFWVAEAALVAGATAVTTGLVTTGTPVRLRCALGTIGGTTVNRWYVLSRNMLSWPEKRNKALRNFVEATTTDIWSVVSKSCPSPYRGEIIQDNPYAWWACDDQPLSGGVQPTSLRNSAAGNTNVLTINAASGGVTAGDAYTTTGLDATSHGSPLPSVATSAVGQQQGWMYGDPQSSPSSYATSNPVTANPGSAAWQQTGAQGSGGSNGWFLAVNDTSFPPLAGGVTVKGWFNPAFFGTSQGWFYNSTGLDYSICGQPYSQITLMELATASAPVCILYLDISGHLILETFNGGTGTTHSIYSTSDLRCASFFSVDVSLTTTTWVVNVNGGLTASASGTATGMTSAWTWLIVNGDLGSSGGSTLSAIQHGGNVAYSHLTVFPAVLPAARLLAHYSAAITGFGLLPAPQTVALSTLNSQSGTSYPPDGSTDTGSYGDSGGTAVNYSFSALAAAVAGSYTSGPSARAVTASTGQDPHGVTYGDLVWVSFTALSPKVNVYTAASANAETEAAVVAGSGDAFTSGYGSGASATGVCQVSGGSGASPPTAASALGDTVQQRIERCLGYGLVTYPGRCIDPAALAVQAATDIGGQQTGQNVQNITGSDGGLMYVDNLGNLTYWQKTHLAGQYSSPVWTIGPDTGQDPYYREIKWIADPQRIWNAIIITPFAPDGATLALIVPTQAALVKASQQQYGPQPKPITSYLQSQTEQQNQANSLFTNFGTLHVRAENVKLDAAPDPALWPMVLGINVADVATAENWQIGAGGISNTFRVSEIKRHIEFNGDTGQTAGSVTLKLDYEPSSYWT